MAMTPTVVCNNILKRAFAEPDCPVSPMKLQKLLYFVACDYQKRTQTPLFTEPFQVWKYGPVLQSVYDEFKSYGKAPITSYAKDAKGVSYVVDESTSPNLRASLDRIWPQFKYDSAIHLSQITHKDGSGWSAAYDRHQPIITPEQMQEDRTYEEYLPSC